jgi:hypothetical protein
MMLKPHCMTGFASLGHKVAERDWINRVARRRRNNWVRRAGNKPRKGERKNMGVGWRNVLGDEKWVPNI